uniref:Uncharacterized protein n=1 Tax=Arundo donax TaxID=35708 RepID=A0A0A9H9E4_ARUDO
MRPWGLDQHNYFDTIILRLYIVFRTEFCFLNAYMVLATKCGIAMFCYVLCRS